jgi:hypothetical protein
LKTEEIRSLPPKPSQINQIAVAWAVLQDPLHHKEPQPMSRELVSIDPHVLDAVTGGKGRGGGSEIDSLLNQLNSITGSIKDITKKTSGLSSTEMLMLCCLAMQNRSAATTSVVYVGPRRGWW